MRTLFDASIPLYQRGLNGLRIILEKGVEHQARTGASGAFVADGDGRLTPLAGHVVAACARPSIDLRRVLGREIVQRPPPEANVEALSARIAETGTFLETIAPETLNAAGERSLTLGSAEERTLRTVRSTDFILTQSIPQFFYHLTAVYVILRYNGVSLRKPDFLGGSA